MEVKLSKYYEYAVHEIVTNAVEIVQELCSLFLWHPIPYFLKNELVAISNNSANKGNMEVIDVVLLIRR